MKDNGGLKFGIIVNVGKEKDLLLEAENEASKAEWMKTLKQHIDSLN